jgi:hypothetical protein
MHIQLPARLLRTGVYRWTHKVVVLEQTNRNCFWIGGIKCRHEVMLGADKTYYHSSSSLGSVQTKMAETQNEKHIFRLSDYDCIGFDLDNTICRYKLTQMVKLEYEVLANYLVTQKGHDAKYLLKPLETSIDFLQKGLVFDFNKGNILQLGSGGFIKKGSHGTRFMSDDEIQNIYGPDRKWNVSVAFCQNMLEAWNGPMSERIRTVSDYFDMPAALAFGRIVDSLDAREEIGRAHV